MEALTGDVIQRTITKARRGLLSRQAGFRTETVILAVTSGGTPNDGHQRLLFLKSTGTGQYSNDV
jgi:hypothetical protein